MQAVILVGGLGTRLRPLTNKIPKAMVLINGKPFLEYQLELLKKNKFTEILLCSGYLGEVIEEYFKDGKKLGLNIKYSKEEEPLGTAGALKYAERLLENNFLLLNGDTFINMDYQNLISFFDTQKKLGVLVVFENKPKIITNNIQINSNKEVIDYNKKEEKATANCVDAGAQVFNKNILELIPLGRKVSLEEEIWPILIKMGELYSYPIAEKFYDMGTNERINILEEFLNNLSKKGQML
jgi:NDP-sugar pyrophosphorylase family protein